MKTFSVLIVIAFCLYTYGCATSRKTYTSDGKEGYNINCSGTALNWGMCYEKAGEICGAKGYIVLEKSGDTGSMVAANQFGLYGGSIINRTMIIQCKGSESVEPSQPHPALEQGRIDQKQSIPPLLNHGLTPAQVFEKVKYSVFVVKTLDSQGKVKSQGSGVLLPSGRIATNCHVVEGGIAYWVGRGRQLVGATLYAEDGDRDICILTPNDIAGKPAQLGKAGNLKVGQPVYAVGAPQGLELSLSDGIVAQLRGGSTPLIQTTTAISPGSSGGGLFDGEGRLVGLTTLYLEGGQSLNFAIPVEWIEEVQPGRKPVAKRIGQTGSIAK